MQSEFTALQDEIHDLKQEFEKPRIFKLNRYIIKWRRFKQKLQVAVHEEGLKKQNF